MRLVAAILALTLTGCGPEKVKPDPIAPVVLAQACEPVEVPVPVHRTPPLELMQPLNADAPEVLPAGQGDYGLTRAGLETLIDAIASAAERLARWRAWSAAP